MDMNRIAEELGAIKAKIDHMSTDVAEIKQDVKRHEARWNRLFGWCISASAGVGGVVAFIPKAWAGLFK